MAARGSTSSSATARSRVPRWTAGSRCRPGRRRLCRRHTSGPCSVRYASAPPTWTSWPPSSPRPWTARCCCICRRTRLPRLPSNSRTASAAVGKTLSSASAGRAETAATEPEGRGRRAGPSEEVEVGPAVVPEEQHGLSDDARSFDGAPEAAVAGDLPVVAHHVELSGRDVKGCLPGGRENGTPELVVGREVRLREPPAVYVDVVAGRIDGLARKRDDALDQIGVRRPGAVVERWVGEHDDVALVHVMPAEEGFPDE